MLVIGVNRALNVHFLDWVAMGSMHSLIVEPREIFRNAILHGASSIILVHNHPSGEVEPSRQDIEMTKNVIEAGKVLRIAVMDYLIVSHL
jgi:DNA repair protein RadC